MMYSKTKKYFYKDFQTKRKSSSGVNLRYEKIGQNYSYSGRYGKRKSEVNNLTSNSYSGFSSMAWSKITSDKQKYL